jgi:lipoyl-dependent peroxiredoxin
MQREATAVWRGNVESGEGSLSTESTILRDTPYSYRARFETGAGTNPEELLAAAHAGCFAMTASSQLGKGSLTPQKLEATAMVKFEKVGENFTIANSHLHPLAKEAETGCPVSRLCQRSARGQVGWQEIGQLERRDVAGEENDGEELERID